VCLSCHNEVPSGRIVYRVVSQERDYLGLIPKTDAEHQKLIAGAMFIASNEEIFETVNVGMVVLVLIIYFVLKKREAQKWFYNAASIS